MKHFLISIAIDEKDISFTNTISVRDSVVRGIEESLQKEFGNALKTSFVFPEYQEPETPKIKDHKFIAGGGYLAGKCMFPLEGTATGKRCEQVQSNHEF